MELVLEGAVNVPQGAVLSIKIGETRRQAPLSKLGQAFTFASSPAAALPATIDVLIPATQTQTLMLDPVQERFVIDLGGNMQIKMQQRVAQEMQRPVPNIKEVASKRGFDKDQQKMAANGAAYLEKHGLVRTLQDLLHGLLVSTPEDPWMYLEQHLARAKSLANAGTYLPTSPTPPAGSPPDGRPVRSKQHTRGSIINREKIDALMDILKRTRETLPLILPLLPPEMSDMLVSNEFVTECQRQFLELDTKKEGKLGADALLPVLVNLSDANHAPVKLEQCKRFLSFFDVNDDGSISFEEFTSLTQFVIVAAHLETDEGKDLMNHVQGEDKRFKDFMDMLCEDKDKINDIVPFLPEWLVSHLTSDAFLDECMDNFDALDSDRNNSLSPDELVPIVVKLIGIDPGVANEEKMKKFVAIFDVRGNKVIMRDEFLECVQFLEVMNFLSSTTEGAQINEAATYAAELRKYDTLISTLENDVSKLPEVMSYLPRSILNEMCSEGFKRECEEGFKELDVDGNKVLDPLELYPLIIGLCEGHPVEVDEKACKRFTKMFDKDRNGTICLDEFSTLCKFTITMAYLHITKSWHEDDVVNSHERIEALLTMVAAHCERLDEVIPLLPYEMQDDLVSVSFAENCLDVFDELDRDKSGSLEAQELVPVIIDMCKANPFALTSDQCLRFVKAFDTEQTGVISRSEFQNFARFMFIMGYLETEDGKAVQDVADLAVGEKKVEELLSLLEHDRNALHKVLPLLPKAVFEVLTSDEFVQECHSAFEELDKDKNGVLSPSELYPIILELSKAHPYSIDMDQCERFTAIFDIRGDGVIRLDEFLDFARFVEVMSYLHEDKGKNEFAGGLQILSDSKRIDELIQALQQDAHDIRLVIPYLPEYLQDELLSEKFTLSCLSRFKELDKDNSGSLDPMELFPVIMDMASVDQLALDVDQCSRFTAIFDDAKTGVISQQEFVNFARFLMVMSFLQTEDGKKVLELTSASSEATLAAGNLPPDVGHLSVDLDYYQEKAQKLSRENVEQRTRMLQMEEKLRAMEDRMEMQEVKLRHAAVELNTST